MRCAGRRLGARQRGAPRPAQHPRHRPRPTCSCTTPPASSTPRTRRGRTTARSTWAPTSGSCSAAGRCSSAGSRRWTTCWSEPTGTGAARGDREHRRGGVPGQDRAHQPLRAIACRTEAVRTDESTFAARQPHPRLLPGSRRSRAERDIEAGGVMHVGLQHQRTPGPGNAWDNLVMTMRCEIGSLEMTTQGVVRTRNRATVWNTTRRRRSSSAATRAPSRSTRPSSRRCATRSATPSTRRGRTSARTRAGRR